MTTVGKFFIAGSFAARSRLRVYRQRLRGLGYKVHSVWLDEPDETWPDQKKSHVQAQRDWSDLNTAGGFVLDTLECSTMGNSYVELGLALASSIPCYLVGPYVNHYTLLCTKRFDTWEEFLGFLSPN